MSRNDGTGVTRREALRAAGGLVVGGAFASTPVRAQSPAVTVATRNCYLGADLFRLLAVRSATDLRSTVGQLVTQIRRSHVEARLDAIAAELERTAPDLVGLQEVALVRIQRPSDYRETTEPNAETVAYDFRDLLVSAIESRGLPYRVVAEVTNADLELPGTVDGEPSETSRDAGGAGDEEAIDVRLTDRDLLLARETATTGDPVTRTFDASLTLPVSEEETITIDRGYGVVDATVGDLDLTVCNTHLESVSSDARVEQVAELRRALAAREGPVVVAGDLNSGPNASPTAYDRLGEAYVDPVPRVREDPTTVNTCCHATGLRNESASLDSRIDHVLFRGPLRATGVTRVGADPARRVAVETESGTERLWPSDHAGVVVDFVPGEAPTATGTEPTTTTRPTATATPTPAGTPTPPPTSTVEVREDDETSISFPGFGPVAGSAALVLSALEARRRAGDD